jgi:adenylate cyclase
MISRLSLPLRLMLLAGFLLAVLVGSNVFLTGRLAQNAMTLTEDARRITAVATANAANRAFGDLKYWLTDLAVSLLVRAEQNAQAAHAALETELDRLSAIDPEAVAAIRKEVADLIEEAAVAIEAYTQDQRVLGNSLMAKARLHIAAVDGLLTQLVSGLERAAIEQSRKSVESTAHAAEISMLVVLVAGTLALVFTFLVLRSVTVPLRRLVRAMTAITGGNLQTEVGPAGRDEIGAMTQTLVLFRDSLVERERLRAARDATSVALQRAQEQLMEAIEAVSEGFMLYGPDDRLVICNSKYRELFSGIDIQLAAGTAYEEIVRATVAAGKIIEAKGREEEWIGERIERHRNPSGPEIQERAGGRWLKISERRTREGGVVGVFTDISDIKAREFELAELVKSLAEARDQALRATESKSRFLANMSHELRTPLNAIIGITEMLQEDAEALDDAEMVEPLSRITRAGRHLLHLINEVLDLARIEAGKFELHLETFAIEKVVQEAVAMVQTLAEKNRNRLRLQCVGDIGPIHADIARVRQALLNLLSNACKFTEAGEVTVTLGPAILEGESWVSIAVADTGIGMTPDQISRLFHEFNQADSSIARKYGGTGLGLAITQRLVTLMGGRIRIESAPNVGTTFTLYLRAGGVAGQAAERVTAEVHVISGAVVSAGARGKG